MFEKELEEFGKCGVTSPRKLKAGRKLGSNRLLAECRMDAINPLIRYWKWELQIPLPVARGWDIRGVTR